ncbi:hypothetical protein CPB84DRAFT_1466837 [Gymnopilus junonius]|uniref:Uncharacterized protein n=1 Tax=Gymnopilus junonius TaxID=109634 RepID=A0A9P5NG04_GYMJU|nr:hypothetical protein CPB84DRAFT_1466837 [Gymnopilus junonius]
MVLFGYHEIVVAIVIMISGARSSRLATFSSFFLVPFEKRSSSQFFHWYASSAWCGSFTSLPPLEHSRLFLHIHVCKAVSACTKLSHTHAKFHVHSNACPAITCPCSHLLVFLLISLPSVHSTSVSKLPQTSIFILCRSSPPIHDEAITRVQKSKYYYSSLTANMYWSEFLDGYLDNILKVLFIVSSCSFWMSPDHIGFFFSFDFGKSINRSLLSFVCQ